MRTIKEINQDLESNLKEYNEAYKVIKETYEKKRDKLYKEKEAINKQFESYIKKQFGKLEISILCNDYGLKIRTKQGELILNVARNEFKAQNIEPELADEIRTKYIETYGLPNEEKDDYPINPRIYPF